MTLDEYQEQALSTSGSAIRGSIVYSMGGIGGEAGEYIDVVKKYLFHGSLNTEQARGKVGLELGDLLWGLAQAADAWGFKLEDIARLNQAKLAKRYADGFSATAAARKADET